MPGSSHIRLDGHHAGPDRLYERYLEGRQVALFAFGGADEAVRIGQERWVAPTYGGGLPWEKDPADSLTAPDLAILPPDRVAFLLAGSTEPASPVEWAAAPSPDGGCLLTDTIVPSAASQARRILTEELAPDAELPASIHEAWLGYLTPEGEWTHDVTWRFEPSVEVPIIDPPAPDLVPPTSDIPPEMASLPPPTWATIDGLGSAVVDLEPDEPERGEVRVTLLEVREDDSYGEIVPYPPNHTPRYAGAPGRHPGDITGCRIGRLGAVVLGGLHPGITTMDRGRPGAQASHQRRPALGRRLRGLDALRRTGRRRRGGLLEPEQPRGVAAPRRPLATQRQLRSNAGGSRRPITRRPCTG